MAEGFARTYASLGAEVYSAGISPSYVHPITIRVMAEKGVDISDQWSKGLESIPLRKIDTVVTLCGEADKACSSLSSKVKRIYWDIQDPIRAIGNDELVLSVFRKVRDEIESKIKEFFGKHYS